MARAPVFGKKYYWEVIPETTDELGKSISGIWNFTMNSLANIQPWVEFEAVASSGNIIKITPKHSDIIEITIYNKGNQYDNYKFELFADQDDWKENIEFDEYVFVPANTTKIIYMNISAPKNLKFGDYQLKLKISSTRSHLINKTLNKLIFLDISYQEEIEEFEFSLESAILISIAIIIIVVVLITIYVIVSRVKLKRFEAELLHAPEQTQTTVDKSRSKPKVSQVTKKDVDIEFQPDKHRKVIDRSSKGVEESIIKAKK